MKCRTFVVFAIGGAMLLATGRQEASAQRQAKSSYQDQRPSPTAQGHGGPARANGYSANLPPKRPADGREVYSDQFQGYAPGDYAGAPCDGQCSGDVCYDGYSYGGGDEWFGSESQGQCFFSAEYLYVKASFSDAVAYLERDVSQANLAALDYTQLEFDYESSYRFGGGWRWCECGTEFRVMFTRLNSSASDIAPAGALVPVEPNQPIDRTLVDADVDMNFLDFECAKTIPLGSMACCDCGDPCGGQCCGPRCPSWDITWSGGVRIAEGGWEHSHAALTTAGALAAENATTMDFEGIGLRTGLEGRRYFFSSGWLSTYMKGDISLLWGELDFETVHTVVPTTGPDFVTTVSNYSRQIVPVTEIEAGFTGQLTHQARVSAGYMLTAWHDLGFRDEFPAGGLDPVFPIRYDDANILGFDGFFARLEVAY